MAKITDAEVVPVCQTLFGINVNIAGVFLRIVQPGGVKIKSAKKQEKDKQKKELEKKGMKELERFLNR